MIATSVVLALSLFGQSGATPEAARLVDQLGSSRFAEREAAAKALEKLGADAVPALRVGQASADLEIRTRSAALLRKAEEGLLTRATLVKLDFRDGLLPEVVRGLSERTGMSIALVPERHPRWAQTRVTLESAEPVAFWQAIDRLCGASGLNPSMEIAGTWPRVGASLGLAARVTQPASPSVDHGPFRIRLVDLEIHRRIQFAALPPGAPAQGRDPGEAVEQPIPPRALINDRCLARLQVMAEPRLGLRQDGALQLLEATDDLGHSLVPTSPSSVRMSSTMNHLGANCSSILNLDVPLLRPDPAGKAIGVLRGLIPLRITARQPEPLVIPLAGAAGRTFDRGELHLTIHEIRSDANKRQRQVELTLKVNRPDDPGAGDDNLQPAFAARSEPPSRQLELIDDRGRVIPWFQTGGNADPSRVTLTFSSLAGGEPKEIRCYRLSEATINVPFAFRAIPLR